MKYLLLSLFFVAGCARLDQVGRAPEFEPLEGSYQHHALYSSALPEETEINGPSDASSLWTAGQSSLFGDRRAGGRGDILTVVVEIDDQAQISNQSSRDRSSDQSMAIPSLFGIETRIENQLAGNATLDPGFETNSDSNFSGNGSVSRNEQLTLRVAATVVEELPNGVIRIEGRQEVRVNFELRELLVSGFIRPADISRQNEITYDKIAGAQISYGGRGQISEVQQPRYGDQITEILLPF